MREGRPPRGLGDELCRESAQLTQRPGGSSTLSLAREARGWGTLVAGSRVGDGAGDLGLFGPHSQPPSTRFCREGPVGSSYSEGSRRKMSSGLFFPPPHLKTIGRPRVTGHAITD